ncbi:MAG: PAC2 family protein [Deltaproteobacteria bacterium]|nr:PAC2 family protein [Deltaproteobacteria bacterium]MBW2300833.1 PAC2 family protein [Deltaproteobacteria bacterium]
MRKVELDIHHLQCKSLSMFQESVKFEYMPEMENALFIAGFEGWGNALDISGGMADYLIRKLEARTFALLNADLFYRFDENRPVVEIEGGVLKNITPPGGVFFATQRTTVGRDIVILKAMEPNLRWYGFADAILTLCQKMKVKTIISLGSMYDNVLHTDSVISAIASSEELLRTLQKEKTIAVNYKGPSAIHSLLHHEAQKRGFDSISLWAHCPYYLQGTTHFGLLSHLGSLLASWGGFELDTSQLDNTWKELSRQIQGIIEKNPELQKMINDLRKAKIKGSWEAAKKHEKVIHLEDFLNSK